MDPFKSPPSLYLVSLKTKSQELGTTGVLGSRQSLRSQPEVLVLGGKKHAKESLVLKA